MFFFQAIYSQAGERKGTPVAEVFTNFHYSLNDTAKNTGFGIERALLGYTLPSGEYFSATVILNIGIPEDLASGSKPRRYAYFREALISYAKDKLTVNMGITKTLIAHHQQIFHGKRYIADNLLALKGFGFVSDLGISVWYDFSEKIKADVSLMNGKGYSNIQSDNSLKAAAGLYAAPVSSLAFRVSGDIMKLEGAWQTTLVSFAGIKTDHMTIGGELSYKSNFGPEDGNDAWGFSGTAAYYITEKIDIFTRYDYSSSVKSKNIDEQWEFLNGGTFIIAGVEYAFTDKNKLSLNFQEMNPYDNIRQTSDFIFLNALLRF